MARALLKMASAWADSEPTAPDSAMIYYRHFGLSGAPFQFTASPKVLYASPVHSNGLAALEGSLSLDSAAVTLLIGAAGSGKTTLAMRMLAREWGRSRVVYLANPKAGYPAILWEISRQLGIEEHRDEREMAEGFGRYLSSLTLSQRILVIIDEAHYLDDTDCDQLEEFLNSRRQGVQRLSLALAGEPQLLERIAMVRHQSLQELTASLVVLKPLPLDEAMRYAEHRLAVFNGSAAKVFAPGALEYLLRHAEGLPLRINILCHNAMLMAHAADATQVNLEIARASVLEFERTTPETAPVASAKSHDSGRESTADTSLRAPAQEPPIPKTSWAPHGMGIGLLILSVVVMSALWLIAMRSEEQLRSYQGDAEAPAIFSEDLNAGSDATPQGMYRSEQSDDLASSSQPGTAFIGKAPDGALEKIITPSALGRPEVTINQTGPDGNSPSTHAAGPGFGS